MTDHPNRKRFAPTLSQVWGGKPFLNAGSRPLSRPTRKDRNYTEAEGLNAAELMRVLNPKRSIAEVLTFRMKHGQMTGFCSLPAMRLILKEGF
jgi:hypothetical protein